jgi:hypothetical protein
LLIRLCRHAEEILRMRVLRIVGSRGKRVDCLRLDPFNNGIF